MPQCESRGAPLGVSLEPGLAAGDGAANCRTRCRRPRSMRRRPGVHYAPHAAGAETAADEVLIAVTHAGVAIWTWACGDPQASSIPLSAGARTDGPVCRRRGGSESAGDSKSASRSIRTAGQSPRRLYPSTSRAGGRVGRVPEGLSLRQAGAIATTGLTAIQGIDDPASEVRETLIIHVHPVVWGISRCSSRRCARQSPRHGFR